MFLTSMLWDNAIKRGPNSLLCVGYTTDRRLAWNKTVRLTLTYRTPDGGRRFSTA